MKRRLEICCSDIDSVVAARDSGADRVELCSALSEGGLTPSIAMIRQAFKTGLPVNVLIRPRSGDFCYSTLEKEIMLADVAAAGDAGASAVVIGALLPDGNIDIDTCSRLVEQARAYDMEVTFHRAFDMCRNPLDAIQQIIDMGCNRLLTSGQAQSALEGASLIHKMVSEYGDRITILVGAGVNVDNIEQLIRETGATEFHASAKTTIAGAMKWRREGVNMGRSDVDEYARQTTSADTVRKLATIIHNYEY